jgi:hypothetical protein
VRDMADPNFLVPLSVLLRAFWTAPVGPQSGAQGVSGDGGSVVGEVSMGGSGTPTPGGFEVGDPPAPVAVLEETSQLAVAAAGDGSIGGPDVPHLVSPSLSSEDSSCVEIPPPSPTLTTSSTTPTMCVILISSDSYVDSGPEEYEVRLHRVLEPLLRALAWYVGSILVVAHLRTDDPLTVV